MGSIGRPGAEKRLFNLGHLTAMRAWEDIERMDFLPSLFLSFCREKRILFFFFLPCGDSEEAFLGYCFQESVGSVLEATLGILILEPFTGSACPGFALTRSSFPHPGRLSLGQEASTLTPVSPRPQALALPPRRPPSLLSSLLSPRPPSFGAPSLLDALPPSLAPSFLRALPPLGYCHL